MLRHHIFTQQAEEDDVDAQTVERDYVLTHVVAGMAELEDSPTAVFKGGTALRLCYFDNYRYSADIDLNSADGGLDDVLSLIESALEHVRERLDVPVLELVSSGENELFLRYIGPLQAESPREVKIDISTDEYSERTPARKPLLPRYADQQDSRGLATYTLTEVAAEKFRCVMQRLQCRDLYDIYSLLTSRRPPDMFDVWPLFRAKARHKGVDLSDFTGSFNRRLGQYQDRWDVELGRYMSPDVIPYFGAVAREVSRSLREVDDL